MSINYETRDVTFKGDVQTINFIDRVEESLLQYFRLKGYTEEQLQQVDFRSNVINSIVTLFRMCNLSPKEIVEHLTLTMNMDTHGILPGYFQQEWNKTNLKINSRIQKIEQNQVES